MEGYARPWALSVMVAAAVGLGHVGAAADADELPRDVAGTLRNEEQRQVGDILGAPQARGGQPAHVEQAALLARSFHVLRFAELLKAEAVPEAAAAYVLRLVGHDPARTDVVHAHPLLGPFPGQRLGQALHETLGGAIVGDARGGLAQQGGVGGDVDDAPSAQSQHVPGDRLAAIHDAINVERNLPASSLLVQFRKGGRVGNAAGIVHQSVDGAELLVGDFNHRLHTGPLGDIGGHCQHLAGQALLLGLLSARQRDGGSQ